ncbi:MAG: ribonuclease III [Treponema sp.]|nr:ribonuclease III [Treponema sp.]
MTILPERKKMLIDFQNRVGIIFKDINLLDLAFHHRSYSNESLEAKKLNNERLEFLGDSVLGLVTADFLYNDMKNNAEGDLAKIKAAAVSEKALSPIALKFKIDKLLVLGKGEEKSGGRTKAAILADCMEAIIGALYLDSGYEVAKKYVLSFIIPEVRKLQETGGKDYKSLLQEVYQKKTKACPVYETLSISGPDHKRVFEVQVRLGNQVFGPEKASSKKEAEQLAAKKALLSFSK